MVSQIKEYSRLNDAVCKQIIGDKLMLSCILKGSVPEFENCQINDIENKYIEGEPEISTVGVHPETTNVKNKKTNNSGNSNSGHIRGMNTENATDTEGKITYDIRFYALTPGDEPAKIIINVEAQNKFYSGYPLLKRAVYYAARQISSQYDSEFDHAHYEKIKKVYSIWICFAPPVKWQNTITRYQITERSVLGNVRDKPEHYDLMTVVMICLGKSKEVRYTGLVKLLNVFLSKDSTLEEKRTVLKSEFGVDMPARLVEKEVNMCNYSEFIMDQGIKKGHRQGMRAGRKEGIKEGMKEGMKEGKAEALINMMKNLKLTMEQALEGLSIPESQWDEYRALVKKMEARTAQ